MGEQQQTSIYIKTNDSKLINLGNGVLSLSNSQDEQLSIWQKIMARMGLKKPNKTYSWTNNQTVNKSWTINVKNIEFR